MKKNIAYKILVFSLVLGTLSCGKEMKVTNADDSDPIKVIIAKVASNDTNTLLSVSGKIQAIKSADLSTRMMGYVDKVLVNVGHKVRKGQLLVSINNDALQAQREQVNASIMEANVAFNNAKKDYNRFKSLFEDNSASQKELDDITAHYEMAKARLASAKQMKNEINAQFAYSNITAPFSGVITSKNIKVGDMANPGVPLISIESPGDFEVIAMVPETEISQIESDSEVNVIVKALDKTLKGKVTEVSTSSKNTGGQYLVKVALNASEFKTLSGMFVTVQFPIDKQSKSQTVLVPKEAIIRKGQLTGVYTVSQSNTALLRWLRLGRTFGDEVEVLAGLNTDENYIVSSDGKLYNGAKISIK